MDHELEVLSNLMSVVHAVWITGTGACPATNCAPRGTGETGDLRHRPPPIGGALRRCSGNRDGDIVRYHKEVPVTDILIRDVPDDVLAAIDAKAKRVGLSRTEYLRRALEREGGHDAGPVTVDQLERFAQLARDLDDPTVMSSAWS